MRFVKNRFNVVLFIIIAMAVLGFSSLAGADSTPGSTGDPLVTRSFVERYVQEMLEAMGPSGGSLEWSFAEMDAREEFIGTTGTEFIVRSGQAVVVDFSGSGIPDLTSGSNVFAGQVAQNNHLFTIPKDDGRGIQAVTPTIIMYRGL